MMIMGEMGDEEREEARVKREEADLIDERAKLTDEIQDKTENMNIAMWLQTRPIRSHEDVVKDYSIEFDVNLTDAKKALLEYPEKYEIQGNDIPTIIKEMRMYRRTLKGEPKITFTNSIDNLINGYTDYLHKCIDSIYWVRKYKIPLRNMNFNESDLLKISKIQDEDSRRKLIDCLCNNWEANLNKRDISYGKEFASLSKEMASTKRRFKEILKETTISVSPKTQIKEAILKSVCDSPGISSREIHDSLDKRLYDKSSPQIIAKLAREQNITNVDGAHYKINDDIKKNIWAYTAAFIDSDGYITMDKNHNPRVGLVATGDRGKAFMLEMKKSLGLGRLHLDQKSPQDTRLVNRLNFYAAADVKKLLTKCMPHFRMKGPNAKILLELIKIKKNDKKADWYTVRKTELFKLMKYYNHRDNVKFDWNAWDINIDSINKLEANSKMEA